MEKQNIIKSDLLLKLQKGGQLLEGRLGKDYKIEEKERLARHASFTQAQADLRKEEGLRELARRKSAIAASNVAAKKAGWHGMSKESLSKTAVADKLRLFPNDPNSFFDDYLNPGTFVGGLADGLGKAFGDDKATTMDKVLSIAKPLAFGALGSIGINSNKQWVNNMVNPVAGLKRPKTGKILIPKKDAPIKFNLYDDGYDPDLDFIVKTGEDPFTIMSRDRHVRKLKEIVPKDVPDKEIADFFDARLREGHDKMDQIEYLVKDRYKSDSKSYPISGDMLSNEYAGEVGRISKRFIREQKLKRVINPEDNFLIDTYTKGHDSKYNRRGSLSTWSPDIPEYSKTIESNIDLLENLIKKNKAKTEFDVYRQIGDFNIPIVYRNGQELQNIKRSNLQIGDEYYPGSFQSTSLNPKYAEFANAENSDKIVERINIPGGNKQSILFPNASEYSSYPKELEVILPKKVKMKVEGIEGANNSIFRMGIVNPYSTAALSMAGLLGLGDKIKTNTNNQL